MINLFQNISDFRKNELLKILQADIFSFKKNSTILSILKNNNIIVYVLKGHLQIIRNDYNGNTAIMEELYENSVFGTIISSINSNDYEIVTKEDSKIIVIEYDNIINANCNLKVYNQFIKNLFEIVAMQSLQKTERIEILTKKTTRDKLLEFFEITSKKRGTKSIYLDYSFTDLASYLSVDRSAMSRELSYLKKEGFISVKGKKITLLYKL